MRSPFSLPRRALAGATVRGKGESAFSSVWVRASYCTALTAKP